MKNPYLITLLMATLLSTATQAHPATTAHEIFARMSLTEKIGQLFMVDMRPSIGEEHERLNKYFHIDVCADNNIDYAQHVEKLITRYHLGGVIFMRGTTEKQIKFINAFQKKTAVPLLIGQDAEWGAAMRLTDVKPFPFNMTLGALPDSKNYLIEEVGYVIGQQLTERGVHINFAPVVDVNTNADNPVINYRSFGENAQRVAEKGVAYMKGLQRAGVLACAKHYPGHGNVNANSHDELPVLDRTIDQLRTTELVPFQALIENGVDAILTAHLSLPQLESRIHFSATLSERIITNILRNEQKFEGLIFADALCMNAITDHFTAGQAALHALRAGVDVLLMSPDVPAAINAIELECKTDPTLVARINESCLRILRTKEKIGLLDKKKRVEQPRELNAQENRKLIQTVFDNAVTLVGKLPELDNAKCIEVDVARESSFTEILGDAGWARQNDGRNTRGAEESQQPLLISLKNLNQHPSQRFGITKELENYLQEIAHAPRKSIVLIYGNPYSLKYIGQHDAILVAYQENEYAQAAVERIKRSEIIAVGVLPVST